jgi:Fic family protein
MPAYTQQRFLTGVLISNKLEQTLPAGVDDLATYKLMEEQYSTPLRLESEFSFPPATWPAEGGDNQLQTRQQLIQSAKAAQFLFGKLPGSLTIDTICTTHKLLMWGAVEEDGSLVQAGEYRTRMAHSGTGYIYPPPEEVPTRLQQVVNAYNKSHTQRADSCQLAAQLLYQTIIVHPFTNGNGRLCRLLAAYAAMAAGEPFMVTLNNGHTRARKHYQDVLRHCDRCGDLTHLENFVL